LLDEDQKSLFMDWLGEHGAAVMKVARAYTLTSDDCQDLAQEILLQAWQSLPKFAGKASPHFSQRGKIWCVGRWLGLVVRCSRPRFVAAEPRVPNMA